MITLITGGTGLLGANLARELVDRGRTVRLLVRKASDARPIDGLDVEVRYGDVRSHSDVKAAVDGVASIAHCAAHLRIGWSELALSRDINVQGTRNVADAALSSGARLLYVSTVDTLGAGLREQPANEVTQYSKKVACTYVVTKTEAEREVFSAIERGLDAVVVNPGFILGPWDWKPSSGRMVLAVARSFAPFAPSGGCTVCDVRDVARATVDIMDRAQTGERYILGGHTMTYLELWKLIADVTGSSGPLFRVGPLMRIAGGYIGDLRTLITGTEPDVNSASLRLSSQYSYYCSAKAEREFGYKSRPARQSVEDAWQWLQDHGYVKG